MIVKGGSRAAPAQLAYHLQRTDTNGRVKILELNALADTLEAAFYDWQLMSEGTRGAKGLYHANIDPDKKYAMTEEEFIRSVDLLEEELGLQGQPRAVVMHEKHGREHIHVVWCRTDWEKGILKRDNNNYLAHERASQRMELEFGHEAVPGKHAKRDRRKQPEFPRQKFDFVEAQMAERSGMTPAERSGMTPAEREEQIGAMKAAAANGLELRKALEEAGYVLAQGDRGYLVVDEAGVHSVLSRNIGLKKAETEKFMADVPLEGLPSVEQAQATQEAKARSAQPLEAPAEPTELTAADRKHQITALREQADSAQAFKNALEEAGYVLAHGPRKGFYIVDEKGDVFNLSSHTGISGKEYKQLMAPIDPAGVPDVDQAKALQKERAAEAAKPGPEASKFLPVAAEQKAPEIPPPPAPTAPQPPLTKEPIDFFKHSGIPKEKQDEIKSKFVKPAEAEKAPEPVKAQPQPPVEPVPPPPPVKVEQPPAPPVPEPPALPAKPAAKEQIAEAQPSKFLPAPQPEKIAPPAPPAEDPELVAFKKAIAERQAEENQKLIQKQEQEYKQRDAELAQFNLNSLAGFDAVQRAQMKSLIRRQNEKPTGWKAMMDAAKDAADPLRAAAKAKEQQRARDELKGKQQEERQRYWDIIQESKRVELENFRNRHALQRGDLDRTHEEEEEQLLREREEARKLQAEIEREQREELEKSQGFKHGPPGKGK